jgi:hypothetical protein
MLTGLIQRFYGVRKMLASTSDQPLARQWERGNTFGPDLRKGNGSRRSRLKVVSMRFPQESCNLDTTSQYSLPASVLTLSIHVHQFP